MYYPDRGTIEFENGIYKARNPDRPANFISWDDGCAFADWAGLRPYTELEFEKACRGQKKPIPADFPWGTASRDKVSRYYTEEGDLVLEPGLKEGDLNDYNLEFYGASWYWVMDLSGSFRADHDDTAARDRRGTALKRKPSLLTRKEKEVLASAVSNL